MPAERDLEPSASIASAAAATPSSSRSLAPSASARARIAASRATRTSDSFAGVAPGMRNTPPPTPCRSNLRPHELQDYEMDSIRYSDMPYQFIVTADGKIYEGREMKSVGAHAGKRLAPKVEDLRNGPVIKEVEDAVLALRAASVSR